MIRWILFCFLCSCTLIGLGQFALQPGFDALEYEQALMANFKYTDSFAQQKSLEARNGFKSVYESPEMGLKNQWSLWVHDQRKVALISLRGTVPNPVSWLANVYAAMIPAQGVLQLDEKTQFTYKLAADSAAQVHVGWTVALAYLAPDIGREVNKLYQSGYRDFIVMGHSQGGALAFLVSSYLHYHAEMPKDIQLKTYCSAAPKPGNLYFAYDFEYWNRGGWAYRVVSRVDWVPEVPFSVQQLSDFNALNPFRDIKPALSKQGALQRWYLMGAYRKLDRGTRKAADRFQHYLGDVVGEQVKKTLPDLTKPGFVDGNNYSVAGDAIVLMPDEQYHRTFVDNGKNVFLHHMGDAYLFLLNKQYTIRRSNSNP